MVGNRNPYRSPGEPEAAQQRNCRNNSRESTSLSLRNTAHW